MLTRLSAKHYITMNNSIIVGHKLIDGASAKNCRIISRLLYEIGTKKTHV